jgi:hypothetical protein
MDDATTQRPTPDDGRGAHHPSPRFLPLALALVGPIAITATRGPELWTNPWTWWGILTGSTLGVVLLVARRRAARRDR